VQDGVGTCPQREARRPVEGLSPVLEGVFTHEVRATACVHERITQGGVCNKGEDGLPSRDVLTVISEVSVLWFVRM
jgi:hypothetical protein